MALGHFVTAIGGLLSAGALKPVGNVVGQGFGALTTTEIPDFAGLVGAYWQGLIGSSGLSSWSKPLGIDVNPSVRGTGRQWGWNTIVEAARPIPSPSELKLLGRQGILDADYAINGIQRHFWGDINAAVTYWRTDEPMGLSELIVARNREIITDDEFHKRIEWIGLVSPVGYKIADEFRKEIPGPTQLVHYVLRHGFEPSTIDKLHLMEELSQEYLDWMGKQGLNYTFTITDPLTGQKADTTWAKMEWATHWIPISPGQAYTMYQRLRPSRIEDYRKLGLAVDPFTLDDVRRWLRINDYSPGIRDYLAAISYQPMQTRKVANLYESGIIVEKDVAEYFQDTGLSPRDASRLARLATITKEDKKRKLLKENNLAHIKQAWLIGALSTDEAGILLYRLMLSATVDYDRFSQLDLGSQQGEALADPIVFGTLTEWDLELQISRLKEYIAALKKAYVRGIVDKVGAITQLTRWGVNVQRIDDYMREWDVDLMASAKEVSKGEIIKWYRDSIITLDDAIFRLRNLKYSDRDIAPVLGEAQRSILLDLAKAKMAAAKSAEQKRRALLAYEHALVRAHRDARSELARHGSISKLGIWYKKGILDERTTLKRLYALDWPAEDARNLIKEWDLEKAPKPTKPVKPAKPKAKPKVSVATLAKWWRLGIIGEDYWTERMGQLGYNADDIQRFEQEYELPPLPKGATAPT